VRSGVLGQVEKGSLDARGKKGKREDSEEMNELAFGWCAGVVVVLVFKPTAHAILTAQKMIALSSTEAEYMSLSNTCRQLVWMCSFFEELGMPINGAIPLCGDNQGAIFNA